MKKIIDSFVDLIIEQKRLQFTTESSIFDPILFKKKVIYLENNIIEISNQNLISRFLFRKYEKIFGFKINSKFSENIDFIKKISEDLNSNGYVRDSHIIGKELWRIIIKKSNCKFKCSFNEYIKSINTANKPDEAFNFIEAYSSALPTLELEDSVIFENTIILLDIAKSDIYNNIDIANILNGIQEKCKLNYTLGLSLLSKSLYVSNENEYLISAIVSGLYENEKKKFYDSVLENLIKTDNRVNAILNGLSKITEVREIECILFFELIKNQKKIGITSNSTLSLIFSILKSKNTKYHNDCFQELESVIENEESTLYIINNLANLNNNNNQKIAKIILKLVNQNFFSIEKYINQISTIFRHITEFKHFRKVALCIIEKKPFEKFTNPFHSYFRKVEKTKFDKFIIELLIDNQASRRATGIEIFNQLSSPNAYQFKLNILRLPYISQYKLWVSLTENFHEPKNRLIALLPLIDSKSKLIKESFLSKLEEISEDYGSHITDILEEKLNKKKVDHLLGLERIKKYIENYQEKNINIKNSIQELNPNQTHYKFIKMFNELFYKNMRKSIDQGARKNSLFSILGANTIQLSKGGGWRSGANTEISPLGSFKSSFLMPRSYFIDPNKFDLEKTLAIQLDWRVEEFIEINSALENE